MPTIAPSSFGNAAIYAVGVIIVGFLVRLGWEAGGAFCAWVT